MYTTIKSPVGKMDTGYAVGREDGYYEGREDGYDEGFEDGQNYERQERKEMNFED